MTKAHCAVVAYDPATNTVLTSAQVNVYTPGTVTPIGVAIYDKNGNVIGNPLTSDATTGLVDFYLSVAQEVDLVVSKGGFTTRTYSNVPVLDDASNNLTALLASTGQIIYASAANTPAVLNAGPNGGLLILASGVPVWSSNNSQNGQINGSLLILGGTGSASQPASGSIRLINNQQITWRNNLNTADLAVGFDTSDRLVIQTTASNLTTVSGAVVNDLLINVNGSQFRIALKQ